MRLDGDGGAASRHVDTIGVFSHGIWLIQAISVKCQPKESAESFMHCARASFTRKHGFEAETNKNSDFSRSLKSLQGGWSILTCNLVIKNLVIS